MTIELTWTHPNGLFATEPYDCMDDALHQKRMYERDGCVVEIEGETEGHPEAAEPPRARGQPHAMGRRRLCVQHRGRRDARGSDLIGLAC